jgi:hypothetical protein
MDLNTTKLETIIQQAFDDATARGGKTARRWQMAIAKAKQEIESNPFMYFDGHALIILSPSNEIYEANGSCQCRAFKNHQPCWHRAAARIVERYNETR